MKLHSIQYLRALAASAVVLAHASTSLFDRQRALLPFSAGNAGVDLFFVISGFIMFYTTDNARATIGNFYVRRLIRVVPLYFILSTFGFVLASVAPHAFSTLTSVPLDYLRSILFIPFYNVKVQAIRPEIGQGWTLNYEMFFYLIFGFCLFVSRGAPRLLSCIAVFSVLSLTGFLVQPTHPIPLTYTNSIMIEFVFGIAIGYFLTRRSSALGTAIGIYAFIFSGIGIVAVHMLAPMLPLPDFVLDGIPAAAIVAGAVEMERVGLIPEAPLLLLVGDASYSLYLIHGFALGAMRRIWSQLFDIDLVSTHASFMLASVVVCTALAIAVYKYLERPMTNFLATNMLHQRQRPTLAKAVPPLSID